VTKRERARAARAMAMAMRVAGNKEGKGNKAMAMATRIAVEWNKTATKRAMVTATRVVGKQRRRQQQQRGWRRQQRWWRAMKMAMATVARAMVMMMKVAGKQIDGALINNKFFLPMIIPCAPVGKHTEFPLKHQPASPTCVSQITTGKKPKVTWRRNMLKAFPVNSNFPVRHTWKLTHGKIKESDATFQPHNFPVPSKGQTKAGREFGAGVKSIAII
jgi:hypothetical protein